MTGSRADISAALVAVALSFAVSGAAFAQGPESGPVRLAPGQQNVESQTDEPQFENGNGAVQSNNLNDVDPAGVRVDSLSSIDPDTAGVLGVEDGGFGLDMWMGTSRRMLETMMRRIPVNVGSSTMRDMTRRLLLTSASVPSGLSGNAAHITRRVGLLSQMGDINGVVQLLDATPGRSQYDELVRHEANTRFLANDNARACSLAAGQIGTVDSQYWQKAFIFCQALAGEHDAAALGVSLLVETGDEDPAFFKLVDALAGREVTLDSLPDPSPLHLSMARVAKVRLPADVVSSNSPGVLRTIAVSPNASVELRLEAAERAEQAGSLPTDTLRQLYTSVSFSDQEMANPLSRAEAESGPLSRALLYRTALIQTVPMAQAEAVTRALSLAREGGRYASIVRVFMPILRRIPPSAELAWFAPEVIRALLVGGDTEAVSTWFSLLRANSLHNDQSAEALDTLLPVARLAGAVEAEEWGPKQLAAWWGRTRDKQGGSAKAALLYGLLEVFGDKTPAEAWEVLLDGPQRV
ncbi:MAG: hypothetical protein HON02_01535, partial [Rhodospirillaceae bacterium]|nr:hypothetical protein [Rhodospirillaceae bacterium]